MGLIELTETYNRSKNQLLLNLINILKSASKKYPKRREKKSVQNNFILKHVIKSFKTSRSYYLKTLV